MLKRTVLSLMIAFLILFLAAAPAWAGDIAPVETDPDDEYEDIFTYDDEDQDIDEPPPETESYIVVPGAEPMDVFEDRELKKKICIIHKEGDSILYYDSHEDKIYHVWFIDQNNETVSGYIQVTAEEPTKMHQDEVTTMASFFGADNREVNGIFLSLFYTNVEYPPAETPVPTEAPVTEAPVTEEPVQQITLTNTPAVDAQPTAEPLINVQETAAPTEEPVETAVVTQTAVVQVIQTEAPATEAPVQITNPPTEKPAEKPQAQNGEVKSVTVKMPSEDDLKALGVKEDTPWYSSLLEGTNLFIVISVAAVILILLIILIVVKVKKKSRGSLLDR